MTVTYTDEVANTQLCGFTKLLLRWKGSVYKLLWRELLIYSTLYTILSGIYRWVDNTEFRNYFEKLCLEFQSYTNSVPIIFLLGLYVSIVLGRWWHQYMNIPWSDRLMLIIAANVQGRNSSEGKQIRRDLIRYLSLGQVFTFQFISPAALKKYKNIPDVIEAGFMTQSEYEQMKQESKFGEEQYILPFNRCLNLLSEVRRFGGIYDGVIYNEILKEINDFRGRCAMLVSLHQNSIPLVFTQVVTIAVYSFFASTLLSRQYLDITKGYPGQSVDLYVPFFTIGQFLIYFGLLKLAEQLINPFGEDDGDFDVNAIIERNWEISLHTVERWSLTHSNCRIESFVDSNPDSSSDKIFTESSSHSHHHATDTGRVIKETFSDQETSSLVLKKPSQIENGHDSEEDFNVGDTFSGGDIVVNLHQRRDNLPSTDKKENERENNITTNSHRSSIIGKKLLDEPNSKAKKLKKSVGKSSRSLVDNKTNAGNYDLLPTTDSDNDTMETKHNPMLGKGGKSPRNKINAAKFVKINDCAGTLGATKATKLKSSQAHRHPVPCSDIKNEPSANKADYHNNAGTSTANKTSTDPKTITAAEDYLKESVIYDGENEKLLCRNEAKKYKVTAKASRKKRRNDKNSSDSWPEYRRRPTVAKTKRRSLPIQQTSHDIESAYNTSGDLRRDTYRMQDAVHWERERDKIWIRSGTAENPLKSDSESNSLFVSCKVAENSDMNENMKAEEKRKFLL